MVLRRRVGIQGMTWCAAWGSGAEYNRKEKQQLKSLSCLSCALLPAHVTLLGDGELGTLALGQGDPGLRALTDNENVRYPSINISIPFFPD